MPQPNAGQLRARPDFYIRRWRTERLKDEHRAKVTVVKLHRKHEKEITRVAKSDLTAVQKTRSFLRITDAFVDDFARMQEANVNAAFETSAKEAYDILNLMLPKGVRPPGSIAIGIGIDPYRTTMKGATPEQRVERLRLKTRRSMQSVMTRQFVEAVTEEEVASASFQSVLSYAMNLAENDEWLSGVLGLARGFDSADVDVIDHYEFLATLDALTCEECGSLDGSIIPAGDMFGSGLEIDSSVEVHNRCRCVAVPVTKTWEELGFEGIEEPEGSRISRPYYPVDEKGERDWGNPSSPQGYIAPDGTISNEYVPGAKPIGGVQEYVPASTRYEDWIKTQGEK